LLNQWENAGTSNGRSNWAEKQQTQPKLLPQQSPGLTHKSTHVYIGLATRIGAVRRGRCASISVDKFVNLPGNLNDIFQTNLPPPPEKGKPPKGNPNNGQTANNSSQLRRFQFMKWTIVVSLR